MSSWSENWIYNLIPQEEYELAFDMVNGKSISCVLNQEEEIDYSKIEHVQEILELTLMDILKSEDVNEKDVAEVSQKIYLLLSALPMPVDSIEKAKHVLKILVYSYIGEQWESGRRYLIENNINILVEEKDDWNICVFKKICNALFLLVKKENWKDLTMACQLISELREDQKKFELYYINSIAPSNKMFATYELISLYHLAKIVDIMATFMINGEILDIREQIGMHFGKAIEAAEEGGIVSLNLILIMLQRMLQKMISNSVWMVTQRVNSRVTKFVRNITTQDKAVFELMYPQKHAILEEGLLDPAHKAIVVNMPTSSGKTLIAQFRILQALNQFSEDNGWVVYIAPTRALVNQVAAKLKREFEPIGIKVEKMSGAIEIDSFESNMLTDSEDRFDVLVVTPEKMNLLIRDGIETKMGRPLALAVVDEAHNIEEESRGINLEILLANIKNDCSKANFLLLTPFIKNSEEIAKWLDADSPKSISLAIDWKPNKRILGAIYPEGNRRNWKLFYQTLLTNSAEIQLEKKLLYQKCGNCKQTAYLKAKERYDTQREKLAGRYKAKTAIYEALMFLLIWYSVSTTLFQMIRSKIFISDCVVFFDTIATFIQNIAGLTILAGKNVAQVSNGISNPVVAGIIYWMIRILISGGCLVGVGILLAFIEIKIAGLYKKYCWDMITIMVILVSMAIAIYFADWIRTILPVNLLFLLLLVQVIYVVIRWYVKGWRETRGYY